MMVACCFRAVATSSPENLPHEVFTGEILRIMCEYLSYCDDIVIVVNISQSRSHRIPFYTHLGTCLEVISHVGCSDPIVR